MCKSNYAVGCKSLIKILKKPHEYSTFLTLRPSQVQVLGKEKRAAIGSFLLVEATGLVVRFGFALHTDSSTTVASDSTRLTAPR